MNVIVLLLILSNLALWLNIISLRDIVKRNEAITDIDRERNTVRYNDLFRQIAIIRRRKYEDDRQNLS
jgi:hypothetical protein